MENHEAMANEDIVIDYNILEDKIIHKTEIVKSLFGLPMEINHAQDYLVRYGVIRPESVKDFSTMFQKIRRGEPHAECIVRAKTALGELLWIQMMLTTIFENGQPTRAVGILKDVTEQYDIEMKWNGIVQRHEAMRKTAIAYYHADLTEGKIIEGMDILLDSMGFPSIDSYEDATELLINSVVYPEERMAVKATYSTENLMNSYRKGQNIIELQCRCLTGNNGIMWIRCSAYLVLEDDTNHIMLYFYVSDISDLILREEHLREKVEIDPLTGLYNKVTAELLIQEAISEATADKMGTLLLIRLNDFQLLNENLGRYYWDALLSELGHKLKGFVAEDVILGRSDDTEFILYSRNINNQEEAYQVANSIYDLFCQDKPGILEEKICPIIIGGAFSPTHGDDFEILYHNAKIAVSMCSHKSQRICFYQQGMKNTSSHKPQMEGIVNEVDKPFSENMMEYVFRILFESKDIHDAVQAVLELISKQFNFTNYFVYNVESNGEVRRTYEYKKSGCVLPDTIAYVMTEEEKQYYHDLFRINDIHIFRPREIPKGVPIPEDLKLRILYGFNHRGQLRGIFGFDYCEGEEFEFTAVRRNLLQSVAQLLAIFLTGRTTNEGLWESASMLRSIVDGMHNYTYVIDPETHIIKYANYNTQQGLPEVEEGKLCYEVLRNRTCPCEECPIDRMVHNGLTSDQCEMYLDQCGMWARINSSLITTPNGYVYGVFNGFDFSAHKHRANRDGEDLKEFTHDVSLYDALSLSTDDYIIMCDMPTKRFYFPKKMVEEFNLPKQVIEDAIPVWLEHVHEDDREEFNNDIEAMFMGRTDFHNQDYRVQNKDGLWVWVRARGHVERNENGEPTLFVVVMTKLGQKSKVDALTGLLDKYEFEVSTRAKLAEGVQQGALLILGLDNFSYINNIYGWDFGDYILKESALRIYSAMPDKAQVFRLDGDKFGVFLVGTQIEEIEAYYHDLSKVFRNNRQFGEHRYCCTISCGCVVFKDEDLSFVELFKRATCALEYAKREGKSRLTIYDEQIMSGNERVLALLAALHDSVDQGCKGFEIYYQPQVKPKTFEICSAEALLRYSSPEFGMVSPVEFIPLLEQTGLIHRVGKWTLENAADTCKQWRKIIPGFTISVNISFVQLQEQKFMSYLEKQIENQLIDPEIMHLEITESYIADGSRSLSKLTDKLRALGFKIEMDDFGTGYSSLEILKNSPADLVKIDRAFVRDITHSDFDATFIQFVVALCHSINVPVCLEGVETWEEYHLVESMDIDLIQGFLFGKPLTADNFEKEIVQQAKKGIHNNKID